MRMGLVPFEKENAMAKAKKETKVAKKPQAVCFQCGSTRLVEVGAKCNDLCRLTDNDGNTTWGYVPKNIGLGTDENYVAFTYCRECGQMQNEEFRTK